MCELGLTNINVVRLDINSFDKQILSYTVLNTIYERYLSQ